MSVAAITIGVAVLKMGVLAGAGIGLFTGFKWFGNYNPSMSKSKTRGGSESDDVRESLRKRVAERS